MVKFCRLLLRPGIAGYHPSTDRHFGRTVMFRPESIERQEENERGSVEIKLNGHSVIQKLKRLIKGMVDKVRVIVIVL